MRLLTRYLLARVAPHAYWRSWWRFVAALTLGGAAALHGCSSLTPVEKLVIAQDAEPLLAQIRGGQVGVDELLPWGGSFGAEPSYFTPLCAAAFGGVVSALEELLALGADVDVRCSPSATPMELALRHPFNGKAVEMRSLLQAGRTQGAQAAQRAQAAQGTQGIRAARGVDLVQAGM